MHPHPFQEHRAHILRLLSGMIALACFIPLALGTSPVPPPYYRYVVNGRVSNRDGTPAPDVIVVMFTRTARDTAMEMSRSTGMSEDRPLGVSYSNGGYSLSVRTEIMAESLMMGCIVPGRPMVRGTAFHPDSSLAYATRTKGTSGMESGCSGCGAEPSRYEYTVSYTTSISKDVVIAE